VFIAADGRCKGRTGSPPWNGQRSRLGDLNRLDTPAESKQQVCCPLGRLDRRTTGAGSREQGAGPAHPCSLLPAPCSLYSRLLYTSAVCSAVLCQVNVRARARPRSTSSSRRKASSDRLSSASTYAPGSRPSTTTTASPPTSFSPPAPEVTTGSPDANASITG